MMTGKIEGGIYPRVLINAVTSSGNIVEKMLVDTGFDGDIREVEVILSNDEEPAIGTRLLKGCVMTMNFIEDTLTIDKPVL
jgi:predicted aspartyl protease